MSPDGVVVSEKQSTLKPRPPTLLTCLLLVLAPALAVRAADAPVAGSTAAQRTGEQVYHQMCMRCHGPEGEGVAGKYDEALVGDKSVETLVDLITRTMPEDEPGTCTGEDAKAVAGYVYEKFYSPEARARLQPA